MRGLTDTYVRVEFSDLARPVSEGEIVNVRIEQAGASGAQGVVLGASDASTETG